MTYNFNELKRISEYDFGLVQVLGKAGAKVADKIQSAKNYLGVKVDNALELPEGSTKTIAAAAGPLSIAAKPVAKLYLKTKYPELYEGFKNAAYQIKKPFRVLDSKLEDIHSAADRVGLIKPVVKVMDKLTDAGNAATEFVERKFDPVKKEIKANRKVW